MFVKMSSQEIPSVCKIAFIIHICPKVRNLKGAHSSVRCMFDWYSGGHGFDSLVRQHSFVTIGHKIISTAILSIPLIQVG